MSEGERDIVKRGLRTVIAAVPTVGGFFAQAWSEYEGHVQSERVDEFFDELAKRCEQLEERIRKVEEYTKASGEIPALMERVIYKVERETSQRKRRMYAEALAKSAAVGPEISFDQKITSIDTLDVLTETDIEVLGYFVPGYRIQVSQMLPSGAPWNQLAEPLGKLVVSISKLESRGLLSQTSSLNIVVAWEGDADHWVNRWRRKTFEITPFGKTFVELVGLKPQKV
jgi:hypothetical protein